MSNSYVQGRVREAVLAAKGNRFVAHQLLTQWAGEDHRLLMGMAQPFLKAIIAASLEGELRRVTEANNPRRRAAAGRGNAGRSGAAAPPIAEDGRLSRAALTQVLSRLGDAPPVEDPAPRSQNIGTPGIGKPGADNQSAGTLAGGMQAATFSVASKGDAASKAGNVTHESAMKAIAKAFAAKKF